MKQWCESHGYGGVTKQCLMSAMTSASDEVMKMAKREKRKGVINNGKR